MTKTQKGIVTQISIRLLNFNVNCVCFCKSKATSEDEGKLGTANYEF